MQPDLNLLHIILQRACCAEIILAWDDVGVTVHSSPFKLHRAQPSAAIITMICNSCT